jgi:hypothetical protein
MGAQAIREGIASIASSVFAAPTPQPPQPPPRSNFSTRGGIALGIQQAPMVPQQPSIPLSSILARKSPEQKDEEREEEDPESSPNLANQPSVDVSTPDPRPPSPQAPAGAPLVAAQPAYVGQPAYVAPVFVEANVPTPGGDFSSDPFFRAREALRQFEFFNKPKPRPGSQARIDYEVKRRMLEEEVNRLRPPAPVIQRPQNFDSDDSDDRPFRQSGLVRR